MASSSVRPDMSLAEAKLERQRDRIAKAEAALTNPPPHMSDLERGQAPRGKGKWKPLVLGTDTTHSSTDDGLHPRSRDTSLSRSTTSHQTIDKERQETMLSDAYGFQVYTNRKARKNTEQFSAYEDRPEEKLATVEATFDKREIYEVFGNALPGPDYIEQNAGAKSGQLQFVQHPNGDVSAHQWSDTRYMWENIGQFSNIRKKIEGQLGADRLKGETAFQTLQQNRLAYFRIIAKQREANIMGLPFGTKDIQAALPDLRPIATELMSAKKATNAGSSCSLAAKEPPKEPAKMRESNSPMWTQSGVNPSAQGSFNSYGSYSEQQYPYNGQQPMYVDPRYSQYYAPQHSRPQVSFHDPFSNAAFSTANIYATVYGEYPPGYTYSSTALKQATFGALAEHANLNYGYKFPPTQAPLPESRPVGLKVAESVRDSVSDVERVTFSRNTSLDIPLTMKPTANAAITTPGRASTDEGSAKHPRAITPLTTRTAMRDSLIKLGDQAKERSLSQTNIRTVLNDPFRSSPPQPAAAVVPAAVADAEPPRFSSGLLGGKTVANPTGQPVMPMGKAPASSRFYPAPNVTDASTPESHTLGDSSPDTHWRKRSAKISTADILAAQESYSGTIKHPPIAPSTAPESAAPKPPRQSINDWFHNGQTFMRQEDFYRSLCAANSSHVRTPPGLPSQADKQPIAALTPISRLLIPVLENLASYVQPPSSGSKSSNCFTPWTTAPEYAIDRGPNGNDSFIDSEWGNPPERIGRDARYSAMPVESVRFGAFGSPVAGAGSGLDRRFAFAGKR